MKRYEFLLLVKDELEQIKKNATPEEIGRLDFNSFLFQHTRFCIYGQMTGDCDSTRAKQIAPKIFDLVHKPKTDVFPFTWKEEYRKFSNQDFTMSKSYSEYTALEKYLYMKASPKGEKSKKHKEILQYLKGEIDVIVL